MFRQSKKRTAKEALHLEQVERALDRAQVLARKSAPRDSSAHRQQVAALAYKLWQSRGSPLGSPEEDWYRAEEQLQQKT
jgi:hypothetical protein